MNSIWNTTRNRFVQVINLQGSVYLCGNSGVPMLSMTAEKDFIAHGYGGSDG